MRQICFLTGNSLKLIAALTMLIDHIGVILLPDELMLRCIGRLSFPIYAFMISEGCRYTKNKTRYFLSIATLAFVCQVVLSLYSAQESVEMSILVTFSLSILSIYAFQNLKEKYFKGNKRETATALWLFLFLLAAIIVFVCNYDIDYGFAGILTPLFASFFDFRGIDAPNLFKKLDKIYVRVLSMTPCLLVLIFESSSAQIFSLAALPLLLLYSEKRGKINLKYFFYIFYPLHLVVLEGIALILE